MNSLMDYDIDDLGLTLTVSFSFTPGLPECLYLSNGDPGYPAEPAEIEITKVILGKTDITVELNDEGIRELKRAVEEYLEEEAE